MGPHDRDQFDDLLDGALKRYGEVEPRVGLQGRVLTRLAAHGNRMGHRSIWALASVVATVAIGVGIWFEMHRQPPPSFAAHETGVQSAVQKLEAVQSPRVVPPEPNVVKTRANIVRRSHATKENERRLPQFPSNNVLNQQELAIAQYVKQFPEQAMLIAKEQQAFEDETRKAEKDAGIASPLSAVER